MLPAVPWPIPSSTRDVDASTHSVDLALPRGDHFRAEDFSVTLVTSFSSAPDFRLFAEFDTDVFGDSESSVIGRASQLQICYATGYVVGVEGWSSLSYWKLVSKVFVGEVWSRSYNPRLVASIPEIGHRSVAYLFVSIGCRKFLTISSFTVEIVNNANHELSVCIKTFAPMLM